MESQGPLWCAVNKAWIRMEMFHLCVIQYSTSLPSLRQQNKRKWIECVEFLWNLPKWVDTGVSYRNRVKTVPQDLENVRLTASNSIQAHSH